jgi:hypothetical protein
MQLDEADPKGLVRESYLIDGISGPECRSIFIDWALSLKPGVDSMTALQVVLASYAQDAPDHPMTQVLREAQIAPEPPRRKGGRAARMGH